MSTDKMVMNTIIISAGFFSLLFGVTAVGFVLQWFEFKLEPVHLFIALIPFVILLIVSGKLKEIKGPGGIALSLRDEVQRPLSPELTQTPLEVEPQPVAVKGRVDRLRTMIEQKSPTTLSFEVGRKDYYGEWAIKKYIKELETRPDFRFILFNDADGKFLGLMKLQNYKSVLLAENIVEKLETRDILQHPKVVKTSVPVNSTNREALEGMDKANTNMLVVVDHQGRFVGVVRQEEIVRKVLAKVLRAV
jgi:cytochrome oxidase Cu insertion factor (SCO1/SenC/PrrC family)